MADTLRVLYVDDEPDLLNIGKLFLEREGAFAVDTFSSASQALVQLNTERYDAVVSDYQMPGMDGITFLRQLKISGNTTPFIIFTGRGREEVVIQALNEGADFYLQKGGEPKAQFAELAHKIRLAVQQRRAEARILDHERREADIINFLPDATFAIDTSGVVIAWNHAMEKMTGITAEEMFGKGNYEYSIPIYHERRPILIDLVLKDDPLMAAKYPSLKRDGITLIAEAISPHLYQGRGAAIWFTAAPLYNTRGEIVGAIESIRDITDRKRDEEKVRESSERYKSLITVSNTGAWEYHRDRDYLWCSPEYFSMLGRDASQFNSTGAANLKETWTDLLHPDDMAQAIKHFTHYFDSGSPGIYENHFRMQHADGRWIWIWSRGWTLRDKDGILTNKTIGTHIDVTESRQAEEARRVNNEHLRLAQEIGQTGSWELDLATGRVWASEEGFRIFATPRPADGVISLEEIEARIPDRERIRRALTDLVEKGTDYNLEYAIVPNDNSGQKIVHSVARILIDAEKKPVRIAGVIQDITDRKRTDDALRQSEANYRMLADNLGDTIWLMGLDGVFTYHSPAVMKLRGYTAEEANLTSLEQTFCPESLASVQEIFREEGKKPIREQWPDRVLELQMYRKDGSLVWTEVSVKAIRNEEGIPTGLQGSSRDITERKRFEEALRESEARYRALVENLPQKIFMKDRASHYVSINEKFARDLGIHPDEMVGKADADLFPPELAAKYQADDVRIMETGQTEEYEEHYLLEGKETWVHTIKAAVRDSDGEVSGVCGVFWDVTEQKKAGEALKESEEKYRTLVEKANEAIIIAQDGVFVFANRRMSDLLGVPTGDLEGRQFTDFIWPDDREMVFENYRKRISGETINDAYDFRIIGAGGKLRWVFLSAATIQWKGRPATLNLVTDITERKVAETALTDQEEQARKLLSQLPDSVMVHQDGIIVYANQMAVDRTGYPREELIGSNVLDNITAEGREIIVRNMARRAAGEQVGDYEVDMVHKSGNLRHVIVRTSPIMFNQVPSVVMILIDITERKQNEDVLLENAEELRAANEQIAAAEEELRANLEEMTNQERALQESRKELADIIEFLPDATFAINTNGEVIAWNHAMEVMTGIAQADMLNKGNYEYSLPFYREARPILIDLVVRYDEKVAEKYPGIRKDGDRLTAEIFIPHLHNGRGAYLWFTTSPLYDPVGKITGAIESIREITEHKEREAALNKKNDELSAAYEDIASTEEELRQQVEEIAITQRELQESEQRYRNIVGDQTEFICRFLPDGTHIFVNDAYCRYFGIAREDILRHRFRPVIHGDDRAAVTRFFASRTPENPVDTIDHRIIMPDGTTRWQRWSDRALFDDKGTVIEFQSVGRDITEYKQAEEQLQKTVMEYQDLLENISDVYYRSDKAGNLIRASRSWATLLGYPDVSECIGKNIASVFYANPEDRKSFLEEVYRTGSVTDYEIVLKKRDGSFVTVATSSYLYFDTEGHVLGVEGTFRDITERNQITECLKEAEQRLTDIISFLPDATFAIDGEGTVIAWNRAIEEMTGVPAGDMIGKGNYEYALPFYGERRPILIDLIFKDELDLEKNYSTVRRDGNTLTAETGMAHLGGKNLILWGKASPLYDSGGEVIGAIESIRDFTERRMLENSLQQVNRKLNLMSSITRHDIVNNITVCLGYLELSKQNPSPEEIQKLITILEQYIGAIQSQIEFTRVYQDLGVAAPVWQDIGSILQKCSAAQKVPVISGISNLEVYADPLIGKVFYNLHDNAVRHGEHATGIHVRAEKRGNDMVIVWQDNGIGVPPDEKEKIFDRGFGKNTGLGLALAREILDITGITIKETGEPGKGARFEMTVPKGMWRMKGKGT